MNKRNPKLKDGDKRMFNVDELQMYMGVGKGSAIAFAKEHGALKHIGKRVIFDKNLIDKALDSITD